MFTGLIEEVGRVKQVRSQGEAMELTFTTEKVMQDIKLGDSIAVNGVCLTVTAFRHDSFATDVMPETYRQSSLNLLKPGDPVNLERAMLVGARFGGHIVQGHVDGTARIIAKRQEANAVLFELRPNDDNQLRYMINKGSITVDGISLTIVAIDNNEFVISIIPHTLAMTALQYKKPGDLVNLETDIIGKYVDHLLHYHETKEESKTNAAKLSTAYLAEHGFL